jgi:ribosomal protein S18 acetylase RimI-like enzyme
MKTRACTPSDIPHVINLWKACGLTRPWNDPTQDLTLALEHNASTVLLGEFNGAIIASVMAGFDGHRGWLYYVAVRPDLQGNGYGRQIITEGEDWLREQGCPKILLIIRAENQKVLDLYASLDYVQEPRAMMSKWLVEPPAAPDIPAKHEAEPRVLDVTVTFLEMTQPPQRPPRAAPVTPKPLALQRVHNPTVSYYRYLQHTVGDPWLWWERRVLSDENIAQIVQDPKVELYVLTMGGTPAGFVELDFRAMPDKAEVAYFGLFPEFIGHGLGPYLLEWGIDCAWNRDPAPERLTVNTCTLDHPKALSGYQRAGFEVVDQEKVQTCDPVAEGHIPKSVRILSPGY